jgi:hypothetical protein
MSCRIKENHGRKVTRRSFRKTEIDEEAWLLHDTHKSKNVEGGRSSAAF